MKRSKLSFIPTDEMKYQLPEIHLNTITQLTTKFSYLLVYARVIENVIPEESLHIKQFFQAIEKVNPTGFRVSNFIDIWCKYNMTEISGYNLLQAVLETEF